MIALGPGYRCYGASLFGCFNSSFGVSAFVAGRVGGSTVLYVEVCCCYDLLRVVWLVVLIGIRQVVVERRRPNSTSFSIGFQSLKCRKHLMI